jgi:zinc protease
MTLPKKPPVRKPELTTREVPVSCKVANGSPLFILTGRSTEIVRIDLQFDAGMKRETIPLQSQFTSLLLPGGTSKMSAAEIDASFDFFGSFPVFMADREKAVVQLYMLPGFFETMLPIMRDIIIDPLFPEEEFSMQKESKLQKYYINRQKVSVIALDYFFESIFGADHPYGKRIIPAHFEKIGVNDLKTFHSDNYRGKLTRIALSGNVSDKIVKTTCECFGDSFFNGNEPAETPWQESAEHRKGNKLFIEKEGSLQSSIRIGMRTVGKNHPDYLGLKIVDTILGGYFGSRLMQNLREDKGYTYSIGSQLSSLHDSGIFAVSTEVGSQHTSNALSQIYFEIERLGREKVPASELKIVKTSMLGSLVRLFDGPFSTMDSFLSVATPGPGMEYFSRFEETIRTITPDKIKELASTYYNIEYMHEIVVGSRL